MKYRNAIRHPSVRRVLRQQIAFHRKIEFSIPKERRQRDSIAGFHRGQKSHLILALKKNDLNEVARAALFTRITGPNPRLNKKQIRAIRAALGLQPGKPFK